MNRTAWRRERRMEKFEDVPGRFESKRLSAMDAAEPPGMSERSFRRHRRHHEEGLQGPCDRRLGKASAWRWPSASRRCVVDRSIRAARSLSAPAMA